jgi:hypothetical protein
MSSTYLIDIAWYKLAKRLLSKAQLIACKKKCGMGRRKLQHILEIQPYAL